MASPNSSPGTPNAGPNSSGPESLLESSQRAVVEEGTRERTQNKSQRDLERPSFSELVYTQEQTNGIIDGIRDQVEKGTKLTKAELIHQAAEQTIAGRKEVARADNEAYIAKAEGQGKSWLGRLVDRYRHSRTAKLAVAAVTTAGAIGLAASGLWMPALGVKLASGALRYAATRIGAKEGLEHHEHKKQERGEKKGRLLGHEAGMLHIPEGSPDDMLAKARELVQRSPQEAIKRLTMMESPQVKARRPLEVEARADDWMKALYQAELERVEESFKAVLTQRSPEGKKLYYKKDLPDRLGKMVYASIAESLAQRRDQIAEEQATRSRHTKIATALAVVAGVSGVAGWMTHVAEHGHAAAGQVFHPGVEGGGHAHGARKLAKGAKVAAEYLHHEAAEFTYSADHAGDSFWTAGSAAVEHATHTMPEARHLGKVRKLIANDYVKDWLLKEHGGDSLVAKGEHIKIPHEVLKGAVSYAKNYKLEG